MQIYESSFFDDRRYTQKAIAGVVSDLKKLSQAIDNNESLPISLLARDSICDKQNDEINFTAGKLWGYVNPGHYGYLKLKVIPTKTTVPWAGQWGMTGEQEPVVFTSWSDKPQQKFYFQLPWMVPGDGNGPVVDGFNYKLFFLPNDNVSGTLLWSKINVQ